MKKYLISIEREDSPRLATFFSQQTFQKSQADFKKIGVRGADLPTAEYFKLAVAGKKKPLSPAELGCTLSHVNAFKDFLESDEQYACIFEDDAICTSDFDLDSLESEIPKLNLNPCFFLSMGGIQLKSSNKVRGIFLKQKLNNSVILKIHPIYFGRLFYTYAYVIDRKMAELLLRYHEVPKGCDHWSQIREYDEKCQFYATFLFDHPELGELSKGQSYIEQERALLKKEQRSKKSIFYRWKLSILKRFLNLTLKQYPK
ncbi:glycosyltransferase family 25 protein [Acinetobacter zhairhuonensis]|uniref:glycosyltransferase family 25 protein n=1 Tax=Acinetobacter sp. A7.4 TaxID=2919921 RepID=UPI001F4E1A87|nr:glycosyltransferase family 25 protein [Acinetobacter sp. A7.4]MCJ8161078.1 glycosyltransferase family 25 protein [Acinetobacter sp. A7.4]